MRNSLILLLSFFAPVLSHAQTASCSSYKPKVTIQLTSDGVASPDPACVAKAGLVVWCSSDGDFAADFDASPFESNNAHVAGKKGNCSKPEKVKACSEGTAPCHHVYSQSVSPGAPGDPEIIVQK